MTENMIPWKGGHLGYRVAGSGFPLVLIHGFCEDHTIWNQLVLSLMTDFRILLPDLPGFGSSSLLDEDVSMHEYANAVYRILQEEHITSCLMLGHSMGGYVTLNFAARFHEYLRGFGLFHSSSYEDDEAKKKDRIRVAELVRSHDPAAFINELYNKLFAPSYLAAQKEEVKAMKAYAVKISPSEGIAQASLAMSSRMDTTPVLRSTKVPVLFIIGKKDLVVSPEKALEQSHLPDRSVICCLEEVGHMGMLEAPRETEAAIRDWAGLCLSSN